MYVNINMARIGQKYLLYSACKEVLFLTMAKQLIWTSDADVSCIAINSKYACLKNELRIEAITF